VFLIGDTPSRGKKMEKVAFTPVRCRGLHKKKIKKQRTMEMYGNVKCVTHSELVDGGVITQAQYINYSKRRQFVPYIKQKTARSIFST